MNQKVLCHFDLVYNDKYFEFSFQPGVVVYDDIYGALDLFKQEVDKLKEQAVEQEAKLKAEADAKESELAASKDKEVAE